MDGGNSAAPSASGGDHGGFGNNSNGVNNGNNGRGGNRRLTNMEQHLLAEDNSAAGVGAAGLGVGGPAGYYGARGPTGLPGGLGMYGGGDPSAQGQAQQQAAQQRLNSIYGAAGLGVGGPAGLRGVPGLMNGQFDDPSGGMGGLGGNVGLAGLQAAQGGLGGLNAMNGLGAAQGLQQQQAAQQRAMVAQQQAAGVDFQGMMPSGFEGADASAALLGNPAAMAGYPFQTGFNVNPSGGLGGDGSSGGAGLLNVNAAALGGAPGAAMAVAARNVNAQFGQASAPGPGHSLFDQGYQFARSEMALARHQAALNNNAALMGGGGQAGLHLAGLDRQGLRGLGSGVVNPYAQYGADPLMGGAAGPGGVDPYMTRGGIDGGPSSAQHLATIPAIRLAQHRSALQRRMLVNNLPERKDGSFPVVLYQESDEHKLTAYQCLLRKQLELFEADEDDVRCSTRQGRTAPIKLGQVGLRCRHCAGVQLAARTKGAAYYSQTVEGIYQIAQNMSKVHLCERCYRIPRDVRRQLIVLRSDCRRAIGGKEYWSENIRALGVYVDEGILRVKKAPKEDATKKGGSSGESSSDAKKEGDKKDSETKDKDKVAEVKKEGEKKGEDSSSEVNEEEDEAESKDDEKKAVATPMDEEKETKTPDDDKEESSDDKETAKDNGDEKSADTTTEEKADDKDEKEDEDVPKEKPIEKGDSEAEAKEANWEDKKEEDDEKDDEKMEEDDEKDDEKMEEDETKKDDDEMEDETKKDKDEMEDETKKDKDEEKETDDEPVKKKDDDDDNSMEIDSDPAPAAAEEDDKDKKESDYDEKKDEDAKEEKATATSEAKDDEETEDEVEDENNNGEEGKGSIDV
jgi:hypothetical protein